ncbi:PREDICTED: vesicle-associated protein 1-2 isoform X1 [Populus euphratica]|uniref:Vesicle-associated protein 1-2 isoform X1 n=1 Tax=Populus euphratica TaxID=75702 RepID=A0AAJ6U6B0_POPEU|nr:PREDICTED: vesicle-associated protein 1-2 isoform X1 [Populus euphratica]XP_011023481.1 PREDICTED: vesicle-associated protein 1-2 isoform X1 [Populus euphratica]XP_011023482.1 PREDICTED: vesicle-associated protein 1-2 isoform X1 [Populus euphratica]XP_011023486.1 PREDICTED: vesicle-associated protein 1-2 isoform X1 [Populus euphratica]
MTQLLEILPKELKFIFEVKKQSSCSIQLTNNTYHNVAFKVKTTSPKKYCVRPNVGIVDPKSTFEFIVTMQAQKVAPHDMVCKDKFLILSTIVPIGATEKDITPSMFAKDNGNHVEEVKMRVAFISPPESPVLSPINGVLKQGPFFEPSVLNDHVQNRDEILTPPQTHQIAKSSEFKMTNGHEFNTANDVELKPNKDGIHDQELKPKKDGIHDQELKPNKDGIHQESELSNEKVWLPNIDVVVEKELKLEQDEELKQDKDASSIEHSKLADDMESPSLKNEEVITVNAVQELKLARDIEEMKSKLHVLELKLNEAEATISKLTEEKRQGNQEQKILLEELDVLRSRTSVKRVYVGFPLLFVLMTAFISIMLGYLLRR